MGDDPDLLTTHRKVMCERFCVFCHPLYWTPPVYAFRYMLGTSARGNTGEKSTQECFFSAPSPCFTCLEFFARRVACLFPASTVNNIDLFTHDIIALKLLDKMREKCTNGGTTPGFVLSFQTSKGFVTIVLLYRLARIAVSHPYDNSPPCAVLGLNHLVW